MDLAVVLAFTVAVLLLSLAPGPDMMFIVANAVAGGRRAGITAAVGMSTGLAVHTVAAAFGLGALIQAAPAVLDGVRIAGAAFLLYLAITTWRASRKGELTEQPTVPKRSIRRVYVMAVLTNLANPKVILFYLAFFPQFLTTGPGSWPATIQFLLLGGLFITVGLTVDGSVGLLAGTARDRLLRRAAIRRRLDQACAAIFGALAVRLALDSK
jgi:threonine/homoserine/homoserine lactone efflux protein